MADIPPARTTPRRSGVNRSWAVPRHDDTWKETGSDLGSCQSEPSCLGSTLGIVDFSVFPHRDHEDPPENTMADAERWATGIPGPAYAIDDETATTVTDAPSTSSPRGTGSCFLLLENTARTSPNAR